MDNVNYLNIEYFFYQFYRILAEFDLDLLRNFLNDNLLTIATYSLSISFIAIFGIVYFYGKLKEVEELDAIVFDTVFIPASDGGVGSENERWKRVLAHLDTESQAEWRAAILEADIILDEMTKKMGYRGETLGERLKGVEKSDFLTLNKAWEAHKIRNIIAHEGSGYVLSKREAKRVISLYQQVFEEFKFI